MSEITFLCPECGQKVAVDTNGLGFDLACPQCGKTVPVPWENLSSEAQSQTSASESAPPLQVLPPKSPAEKNLLLKKLRQEKREIVAKKRELTIAIAEIR